MRSKVLLALFSFIAAVIIYCMICQYYPGGDLLEPPNLVIVSRRSENGESAAYYQDTLTGVIYIKSSHYMTVAVNADGTPMTYEQLAWYQAGR